MKEFLRRSCLTVLAVVLAAGAAAAAGIEVPVVPPGEEPPADSYVPDEFDVIRSEAYEEELMMMEMLMRRQRWEMMRMREQQMMMMMAPLYPFPYMYSPYPYPFGPVMRPRTHREARARERYHKDMARSHRRVARRYDRLSTASGDMQRDYHLRLAAMHEQTADEYRLERYRLAKARLAAMRMDLYYGYPMYPHPYQDPFAHMAMVDNMFFRGPPELHYHYHLGG